MKTFRFSLGFLLLLLSTLVQAQKSKEKEEVLLKIGDKPVYVSEFKYLYNKNHQNVEEAYSEKSLNEYLELFIKFKLKVSEAYAINMDKSEGFTKEFEEYRKKLAAPYLTDRNVTERLMKEAYDRLQQEVKASHILVKVDPEASPEDTTMALKKINALRERVMNGEDFGTVAKDASDDPSAKNNRGDLGYFTALKMIYEFENVAYNTPIGKVSEPFRTKFGYHIVKVTDKRKSRGEVQVAHIMIRSTDGMSKDDMIAGEKKISEILEKLKKGEDWKSVCAQFSEDLTTKDVEGVLKPFESGSLVGLETFEDAAFALANPGDISGVVRSPYGFHILKLVQKKPQPTYEELKATLQKEVKKDSRSEVNKRLFLENVKKENKFKEVKASKQLALAAFDTTLLGGKWLYKAGPNDTKVLFSIAKKKYTVGEFFKYVEKYQRKTKMTSPAQYAGKLYEQFVDFSVLAFEESNLESKYDEYRHLLTEYKDGILLFQIMEDSVWEKASTDTAGLRKFYQENISKYQWRERAEATIYNIADEAIFEKLKTYLNMDKMAYTETNVQDLIFEKNAKDLSPGLSKQLKVIEKTLLANNDVTAEFTALFVEGEGDAENSARLDAIKKYFAATKVNMNRINLRNAGKNNEVRQGGGYVKVSLYTSSKRQLEKIFNEKSPLALKVTEGTFEKGSKSMLDKVENWQVGDTKLNDGSRIIFIQVKKVIPAGPKRLEEAKGQIIADYQTHLESQWVEKLRKKYKVEVDKKVLQSLVNKK